MILPKRSKKSLEALQRRQEFAEQDFVNVVAKAAKGRWREILHRVAHIPLEKLDGKFHDCPMCGAADAFRFLCDCCGALECLVCRPRPGMSCEAGATK